MVCDFDHRQMRSDWERASRVWDGNKKRVLKDTNFEQIVCPPTLTLNLNSKIDTNYTNRYIALLYTLMALKPVQYGSRALRSGACVRAEAWEGLRWQNYGYRGSMDSRPYRSFHLRFVQMFCVFHPSLTAPGVFLGAVSSVFHHLRTYWTGKDSRLAPIRAIGRTQRWGALPIIFLIFSTTSHIHCYSWSLLWMHRCTAQKILLIS